MLKNRSTRHDAHSDPTHHLNLFSIGKILGLVAHVCRRPLDQPSCELGPRETHLDCTSPLESDELPSHPKFSFNGTSHTADS